MPAQTNPNQTNSNRDDQGRFTRGNSVGPGNPFARQVGQLRQVILDALTPEEMLAITQKFITLAKEGNVQAAKLLLSYSLGKPTPGVQPDNLDVEEWDIQKNTAVMFCEMNHLVTKPEAEFTLNVVRSTRSGMNLEANKILLDNLYAQKEEDERQARKKKDKERRKAQQKEKPAPSPNGFFEGLAQMVQRAEQAEKDEQANLSVM